MFRSAAARTLVKSLAKAPSARSSYTATSVKLRNVTPLYHLNSKRPQNHLTLSRPTTTSLLYATKSEPPYDEIDVQAEKEYAQRKIEPHPQEVSTQSTIRPVFEGSRKQEDDVMMGGIKGDLRTIINTFGLKEVPKEPLYFGIAGVIPYVITSLSTVFLSDEINRSHTAGQGLLFSPETAHQILDFITPVQIGYGAVIISSLGAVHWGLEYAGYGGFHSYRRYMYGALAPALAWPTMFLPTEPALITQFAAFTFMYLADARATVRGWFPSWYSTYRFVLTFFVGASILVSLIGRGRIVDSETQLKRPADYVRNMAEPDPREIKKQQDLAKNESKFKQTKREEAKQDKDKSGEKAGKDSESKDDEKGDDKKEEKGDDKKEKGDDKKEEKGDDKKDEKGGEKGGDKQDDKEQKN